MHSSTICKNCGHELGLHQNGTERCPVPGTNSTFEPKEAHKPPMTLQECADAEGLSSDLGHNVDELGNGKPFCSKCGFSYLSHSIDEKYCPVKWRSIGGRKHVEVWHTFNRFQKQDAEEPMGLFAKTYKDRPNTICEHCGEVADMHHPGIGNCPEGLGGWSQKQVFKPKDFEGHSATWPKVFPVRERMRKVSFDGGERKGYFHAWTNEPEMIEGFVGQVPAAIIETEDGDVWIRRATEIKFLS